MAVEKIIERDFFPDLPKLQLQEEYIEALNSNDIEKLRAIELKLDRGLARKNFTGGTPGAFETPLPHSDNENHIENKSSTQRVFSNSEDDKAPDVSLDKFLAKNTSEDNASFEKIMEESKIRLRQKYSWLFEKEDEQSNKQNETLSLPSCEDQAKYSIDSKPANVDTWTYKTRNALMYVPEGVELSAKEIISTKSKKDRVIRHENTRFTSDPFDSASCKRAMSESAKEHAFMKKQMGKIGPDGSLESPSETPRVKGYGFLATPSPAPGVDASPLMTWGEIEGTPLRIDATPGGATPGPTFRVPEPSRREQLGHKLVEKMSKQHRDKRKEALARAATSFTGKSPLRLTTNRTTLLSPAAQRLVKASVRISTDRALRNSYTPSSSSRRKTTPTPKFMSPSMKTTPVDARHAQSRTPGSSRSQTSLTDDLLNLPKT
eukprot:gene13759-15198_t